MKYNPVAKLELYVARISSALAGIQDIMTRVLADSSKGAEKALKKAVVKKSAKKAAKRKK